MLLRLQRYNLEVRYKKGPLIYIADTLSPAYLNETASCEEVKSLELVDHIETLPITPSRPEQIQKQSSQDEVCKSLKGVILEVWPRLLPVQTGTVP